MGKKYDDLEILPIKPPPKQDTIDCHPDYFDLNSGSCVVHIGKSKSGKGVCMVNQLLNPAFGLIEKLDIVHVYSPTAKNGDISWRHAVEQIGDTIYEDYSDSHLKSILNQQASFPKKTRPKIAIIFDDIMAMSNINQKSLLWKLSTMYRHYGIALLYYMTQQYKICAPVVRNNTDYMMISRTTNEKEIQAISDEICGKYDGDKQFRKLLNQATAEPYKFLYLKLNEQPSEAFCCFNKKIYTATKYGNLNVDDSIKSAPVEEEEKKVKKKIV